ncbi:MAG: hypothetical protein AAF541_13065 [Pseudomonadota bacterium]
MIFEIRNYHFDPERFDEYKTWAREQALPYLDRELDLVGFWATGSDANEVNGEPMDALGSANITWIIRWPDKAARDAKMAEAFTTDEWTEIFANVPGGLPSYHRMEAKFTESLL